MESINFWDSNIWSFILIIGVLGVTVIFAGFLRNNVKWIKRSMIPSSVLGGVILLLVSTAVFYFTGGEKNGGRYLFELDLFNTEKISGMTMLEILTYNCLGLGFVATALRPGEKPFNKKRAGEVFDSGLLTVSGYLVPASLVSCL